MAEERVEVALPGLARWIVMAIVVVVGIGLYLWLAPASRPVIPPVGQEAAP